MSMPITAPASSSGGHALPEPGPTAGIPDPNITADLIARVEQATAAVAQLRQHTREQLAVAVDREDLDVDVANGILTALGLTQLPRRWKVRLSLTVTVTVTAIDQDQAYDTAVDLATDGLDAVGVSTIHDRIDYDAAQAGDIALDDL